MIQALRRVRADSTCLIATVKRVANRARLLELVPTGSRGAELGVFDGAYSRTIVDVVRPARLHLVDSWAVETAMKRWVAGEWRPVCYRGPDAHKLVEATFQREIELGQVMIEPHDTVTWLKHQPNSSLDWVYLDSAHEFEHVRAELEWARQKVRANGWIMGHDYCEVLSGVVQAVTDFCDCHRQQVEFFD